MVKVKDHTLNEKKLLLSMISLLWCWLGEDRAKKEMDCVLGCCKLSTSIKTFLSPKSFL